MSSKKWEQNLKINAEKAGDLFSELVRTIGALRHPESGCPWDLKQTHKSLRKYMLEEAYEATEAMSEGKTEEIIEELGDVLLQVVLNAQLQSDAGQGTINDVIGGIDSKMKRRHPHVFDRKSCNLTPGEVRGQWEEIKAREKGKAKTAGLFDASSEGFPAATVAYKIGKTAKKIGFDWDEPRQVLDQLKSEVAELEKEMNRGDPVALEKELGDVFFTVAQLTRHLNFDPETVAHQGNTKFLKRFEKVEELVREKGLDFASLTSEEKESFWIEAKLQERG